MRCNLTKQHPGFRAKTLTSEPSQPARQLGAPHTVVVTTPTGHTYTSQAPPLIPGRLPDVGNPEATDTGTGTARPGVTEPPAAEPRPAWPQPDLEQRSPFERTLALALTRAV